jgi:hypothetical protein
LNTRRYVPQDRNLHNHHNGTKDPTITDHNFPRDFAAGTYSMTSAFGNMLRRMLQVFRRFGKHCNRYCPTHGATEKKLSALFITTSSKWSERKRILNDFSSPILWSPLLDGSPLFGSSSHGSMPSFTTHRHIYARASEIPKDHNDEEDNCNVCRNVGKLSNTTTYSRKPNEGRFGTPGLRGAQSDCRNQESW